MEDIVAAMRSGKISDAELRESLQRHGWHPEFPAIQDEHGVTLVGNRRLRLAAQLAIEPVIKILEIGEGEGPDAERFKLAFISNIGGVPLTARERKAFAIYLKQKRDWSQQRIAEALGVGQASVSRYLEGLSTVDNSKGGRPRKAKGKFRDASVTSESESLMAGAVLDEGKPRAEVAEEFGVSESIVRRSQDRELGRRKALTDDPVIDPSILSASAQQKYAALEKRLRAGIEREVAQRVEETVTARFNEVVLPRYQQKLDQYEAVIKARKGVLTGAVFKKIRACLHPDRLAAIRSGADEKVDARYAEAFNLFCGLELVLCAETEMPTKPYAMPSTYEELKAAREATTAKRKRKAS